MKTFFLITVSVTITFAVSLKLLITNQETKINSLNEKIAIIDLKTEKIKNNFTYDLRPQNLKEINENEFNLMPILHKDIIKKKELFSDE